MDDAAFSSPWTPPFSPGDLIPWFVAPTPTNPAFHVSTVTGCYVLLGFLPPPGPERDVAFAAFGAHRHLFDDQQLTCFGVLRDEVSIERAKNQRGLRWFFDTDGKVSQTYGALDPDGAARPYWLLVDPMLRVLRAAPMAETERFLAELATLPPAQQHAGVELVAPVLIAPRVLEPDLCRRLIAVYEAQGGAPSGVMRSREDGRTVGVIDDFKRRRDVTVEDRGLRREILSRLSNALLPEIERVFQFRATRVERYTVACYDAAEGGYFRPHRDNETLATAHRRFACSINLNAEAFEGGDLRFPEFGKRTYRPPTGGAVVFACGLQHEATPVTRGRRYAYLPFLYDEAGAAIRQANPEAVVAAEEAETPA